MIVISPDAFNKTSSTGPSAIYVLDLLFEVSSDETTLGPLNISAISAERE